MVGVQGICHVHAAAGALQHQLMKNLAVAGVP
jgi:hypothetical protein